MTDGRVNEPSAGHPDEELLSAYLDGVLEPDEVTEVREHLVTCASCRARLEELRLVQEVVRTLPFVEPPFGFYERTLRRGPRPSSTSSQRFGITVGASIVGLLAVFVILAVVSWRADEVRPTSDGLAEAHARLDSALGKSTAQPPAGLPATLGEYRYEGPAMVDGRHFEVYAKADREVGVTWWDGELGGAPRGAGRLIELDAGESEGWLVLGERADVAVLERDDRVFAVVAPKGEDVAGWAASLPEATAGDSLGDRLRSAGRSLLEAFGFGG
jgi:hypothetical protein